MLHNLNDISPYLHVNYTLFWEFSIDKHLKSLSTSHGKGLRNFDVFTITVQEFHATIVTLNWYFYTST